MEGSGTPIGGADDREILVRVFGLGRSKVDQLHVTSGVKEKIASLDVTMHDALRVQIPREL